MSKELESLKKKRRFLRKNLTDTLKLVEEELHTQDNHARIQVLKDSIASKWNDFKDIQGAMCALLDDKDIDEECKQHSEYEMRAVEYMAKMTSYLRVNKSPGSSEINASPSSGSSSTANYSCWNGDES